MAESVKLLHAALDESPGGDIILRGSIDPGSMHLLQVADYQREVLPLATIASLVDAFENGSVPDIELGMRGEKFMERQGAFYLQDPVFIIDGLQRVSAALHMLNKGGEKKPRLGATMHFNTTEEWERERFRILNADRTKLSSNVLVRNMRHEYQATDLLYRLSSDKSFVMYNRICWNQRMSRQELISAVSYLKVAGNLHAHAGPGRSSKVGDLVPGLEKIMSNVGKNIFRENVQTFFRVIDQCWGIQRVAFKEGAIYMRANFLVTMAMVFSRHTNFWRGERLFVEAPLLRKLSLFPVTDPQVISLASASGKARDLLYLLIVEHINSGKRSRHLKRRNGIVPIDLPEDSEGDDE